MSCTAILWALTRGREHKLRDDPEAPWRTMNTSERMVLVVIADRSNGSRQCWPSMKCLAADTGLSDRQVRTIVHRLEDAGLIRMEQRGRSMHYWVNRPEDDEQRKPVPPSGGIQQPIAEASSSIAEASSAIPSDPEPQQRKPVPVDSGNGAHSTAEASSAKPIKKNLSRNLRRAGAREGGANAGLEGKEASKRLDVAGLSATEHSAASAWLRHVCGGSTARSDLVSRLATVRKYANPAYRWLREHVALAGEIAEGEGWYDAVEGRAPPPVAAPAPPPAADSRTPAEIAAAMSRQIAGKAHAPGGWVADRNTQIEQLAERRVKSAYLPRELLAARSMMARAAGVAVPA